MVYASISKILTSGVKHLGDTPPGMPPLLAKGILRRRFHILLRYTITYTRDEQQHGCVISAEAPGSLDLDRNGNRSVRSIKLPDANLLFRSSALPKESIAEQARPAEDGSGEPVNGQAAAESTSQQRKQEDVADEAHSPERAYEEPEESSGRGHTAQEANQTRQAEGRHAASKAMSSEAADESGKLVRSRNRQNSKGSDGVHASRLQEDLASPLGPSNASQAEDERAAERKHAEPSERKSESQVNHLQCSRKFPSLAPTGVIAHLS